MSAPLPMKLLSWALSFSLIVSGCANTLPYEILSSSHTTEAKEQQPEGPPSLHIKAHTDGLGWTVSGSQPTIQTHQAMRVEQWKAWQFVDEPYNVPLAGLGILVCTISIPLGLFLAGVIPSEQLFKYPLGCSAIAGYHKKDIEYEAHIPLEDQPSTTIHLPLHDGLLTETWTFPSGQQQTFPHLLTTEQAQHGYPIRLPPLTTYDSPEPPTLRFTLQNSQGETEDTNIVITPQQWVFAKHMALTLPPATAWPATIHLRIDSTHSNIIPPITHHLTAAGLPLAIRTTHRQETEQEQGTIHHGQYVLPPETTPGQWTGATVHIFIQLKVEATGTSAFITFTNIETGLLIASFMTRTTQELHALIDPIAGDILQLLKNYAL